jgi:WD40 repeat protein
MREVITTENAHRLTPIGTVRCGWITQVQWSPRGHVMAVGSSSGVHFYINAIGGEPSTLLNTHEGGVKGIAFTSDGLRLASVSADTTVRLWSLEPNISEDAVLHGHRDAVNTAAFHPDGHWLVTAGADREIRLWDTRTLQTAAVYEGHLDEITSLAFALNGSLIVSGSRDGTVRLWDVNGETGSTILGEHQHWVREVRVSPSGGIAASASSDTTIRLWDVVSQRSLAEIHGHEGGADSAAFSPEGTVLATSGRDQLVRLWDIDAIIHKGYVEPSAALATLDPHRKPVLTVAFNPSGTLLASGSGDNTVRLYAVKRAD